MSRYIDLANRCSFVVRISNPVLPAGRKSHLSLDRRLNETLNISGSGGTAKVQASAGNQSLVVQVTARHFSDQDTSSKRL
jgi:hypothetical protein